MAKCNQLTPVPCEGLINKFVFLTKGDLSLYSLDQRVTVQPLNSGLLLLLLFLLLLLLLLLLYVSS